MALENSTGKHCSSQCGSTVTMLIADVKFVQVQHKYVSLPIEKRGQQNALKKLLRIVRVG